MAMKIVKRHKKTPQKKSARAILIESTEVVQFCVVAVSSVALLAVYFTEAEVTKRQVNKRLVDNDNSDDDIPLSYTTPAKRRRYLKFKCRLVIFVRNVLRLWEVGPEFCFSRNPCCDSAR